MKRSPLRRFAKSRGGASRDIIRKLDALARDICMTKHGAYKIDGSNSWVGTCPKCQQTKPLQWAHIASRRFHSVRWHPLNSLPLCAGCHYGYAHHRPVEFAEWLQTYMPKGATDQVKMILQGRTKTDYRLLLVALEQEWEKLTGMLT